MTPINKVKVAFFLNQIPHYREGLYDRLFSSNDFEIDIYTHDSLEEQKFKNIDYKYTNVKKFRLFKLPLVNIFFSFLPYLKILNSKYDVLVIEGNPRYTQHFFLATLSLFFRQKTVLWTMAITPSASFTQDIRLKWTKLFKFILVYTEKEVEFLISRGFKTNVILSINNGLSIKPIQLEINRWDQSALNIWKKSNNLSNSIILLSCARLEYKNRFADGVDAIRILKENYKNIKYLIIGDGPLRQDLEEKIRLYNLEENIKLVGPVHDEKKLAPFFLSSHLMLHPGSIGLSILHAFSYGLPVITSRNIQIHAPEFSLLSVGINGDVYDQGNIAELCHSIEAMIKKINNNEIKAEEIKAIPYKRHNTDIMAERLTKIIYQAKNC